VGGFVHWQIVVGFESRKTRRQCKAVFGTRAHCELTISAKANAYVWKDDTSIGKRFEWGIQPLQRNSKVDWARVWAAAQSRDLESVPPHVRVVNYRSLLQIGSDFDTPRAMERSCAVYWGRTRTGKSRRAWDEAGMDAYCKDPNTKFWDGYQNQPNVVIDEFRGTINISNMLRWLDRYPVRVEVKGSSRPLKAVKFWITSNVNPLYWYPELDEDTRDAFMERLNITEFT